MENLDVGLYTNFEIGNEGCIIRLDDIILQCEITDRICLSFSKFFTPNGDGVNEEWYVFPSEVSCTDDFQCYIFNRYGMLLKVLRGQEERWDGSYQGTPMPSGDYWDTNRLYRREPSKNYTKSHCIKTLKFTSVQHKQYSIWA